MNEAAGSAEDPGTRPKGRDDAPPAPRLPALRSPAPVAPRDGPPPLPNWKTITDPPRV